MEEIKITYYGDVEFDKNELKFLATLSLEKELIKKITDKMVKKMLLELLNKKVTTDYIEGFEKAIVTFNSMFKN